jgi:archaemetzincin
VAVGSLPGGILDELAGFLADATGLSCETARDPIDPTDAYDRGRGQYDCRWLLAALGDIDPDASCRSLGVADFDLFSPLFTFVFGEATLGGRTAIMSLHRLRAAVYGLPDDPSLLAARARREALHEVGHLLGLVHCRQARCVMRFSGSAEEVDLKDDRLCADCVACATPSVRATA